MVSHGNADTWFSAHGRCAASRAEASAVVDGAGAGVASDAVGTGASLLLFLLFFFFLGACCERKKLICGLYDRLAARCRCNG